MTRARERLLRELRRHVADRRVLDAVGAVPREAFVPPALREQAWENVPLPIGGGQTISQPLVVARMCELLELDGSEHALDVGTGSGYHAAVLARLVRDVVSVELDAALAARAATALRAAGAHNVRTCRGDGACGLPAAAPFDAINVAAVAAGGVPPALLEQLALDGRLVAPVEAGDQRLVVARRSPAGVTQAEHERVRFVPLVTTGARPAR
jgi:protein-L-isoaspartate(D-aspartate) O-methyltransferase